jgi:hypothetical protein
MRIVAVWAAAWMAVWVVACAAPAARGEEAARAEAQPEFRVPLLKAAPKIDGRIDPAEWAAGAGFDGLVWEGRLQQRRAWTHVGATETHLYVAIRTSLPDEGALAASVEAESLKAVYDDAVEVFVNPTPDRTQQVDYQFLANSRGKGGYNVHLLGGAKEAVAWQGGWEQAHGMHDGCWHFECAIPIASMGTVEKGRKTTDGLWRVNLARDWKDPWEWSALGDGGYPFKGLLFRFVPAGSAPAVSYAADKDPMVRGFRGALTVRNPGAAAMEAAASLALERNNMPRLQQAETLRLAPGEAKTLALDVPPDDPTTHYRLHLRVASPDGKVTFYDRTTAWQRAPAYRWVAGKKAKPAELAFRFAYYPYADEMRIVADVAGLREGAELARVTAEVRGAKDKKRVARCEFPAAKFKDGRQEKAFEVPHLEGGYEIALRAEGKNVPEGEVVQPFERTVYPWEHTKLGTSTKVYPPFTPIEVDAKAKTLKTVLRKHTLTDLGLLAQVEATSAETGVTRPILAGPMRYVVKIGGKEQAVEAKPLVVASAKPHEVRTESRWTAGDLAAVSRATWDYDGTVRVDLTLEPTGEKTVEQLVLEIPFRAQAATLIHANSDRIRAPVAQRVPAGEGVVWDASKVACDDYIKNFCPYVYLGDAVRGLCWFAENDRGWSWDRATPNLDVVRRGDQVVLRVHLVNKPLVIQEPRTITFGLLAAPVKPRLRVDGPNAWRYRFLRDKYQLLGTDINWLSLGTCGSVYPVNCDMYFWEMIARGNREKIPEDAVKEVVARGRPFFEPYGEAEVKTWEAHVRHNLSSHLGARMVFYYNRASHQAAPEWWTFEDEWSLADLRSVGKGRGKGEIKIVPSPSYIDHALYWYKKSFEIGANQGVYWDNWFIAPSFNTAMTDAYAEPDGRIVPAAGIWQQRELAKRTFVMMNELGMRPITFPHMTSFNPLPMMAFATVQYDWEWQYSMGDVQDRFPRELILLMTTGDLAGVWPVPLGDAGNLAEDPWTQRTFTGVRLVHELDGYGGFGTTWSKVHQENARLARPVLDILDEPGLVVYRYWDERPLPVASGNPDVPTIVYSVPGRRAVVVATSYAKEDVPVTLAVDAKALGFDKGWAATDGETGQAVAAEGGKIAFTLKKHDVRVLGLAAEGAK